ncbi:MAG: tandem-95 repeat protein, partial [Planctomycetes bacterium]|nr:tandem-95 repeat protein [Planctomycetota bacterium]
DVAGNTRSQSMAIGVQADADVTFRVVLTDLSGATVTAVDIGSQFLAKVYVQDQRAVPRGVFAAFLDVFYDTSLVSLDGSLIFGSDYPNNRKGDTLAAGVINEAGAVGGFNELGGSEYLLLTVPFRAIKPGVATISTDPADLHPQNDILTYDVVTVGPDDVSYGMATLTVNVAFHLENDLFNVDEDSINTSLNVLGNDDLTAASGNALITAVGVPSHGGTVTIAADGKSVLYRPLGDFFGVETFTYRVSDDTGFAEATVTVQVAPINDPPTAVNDEFTVPEDSQNFSLDVLSNDLIAPDTGETLSVISVGTPSHGGTVTIPAEKNRILYTPASNFSGVETFTYTISDGKGGTSQATVTIHITEANDPPAARDDLFHVDEDSSANVLDPLANDSTLGDPGETLTIIAVSTPEKNGTVTIADDGLTLRYTPALNFFGIDRFTYTISDGRGGTAQAAIAVNVRAVNDPPKANNDTFTVSKGSIAQKLDVLANDSSEPDAAEILTITQVGATSAGGTVAIAADGLSVNYTPAAGYTGTDTFTYTIRDPGGATAQATATVTVLDYKPSSLSGYVYLDVNNDGVKSPTETPIGGVVVSLQGTTSSGQTVSLQQTTDASGLYQFTNLAPGTYFVIETQPVFLLDGIDSPGPFGTVASNDRLRIVLPQDTNATNINFGERGRAAHQITVLDFLASSRSNSVLSATNESSGSQWYAIESGWAEAKTMAVTLVQAATAAKLDVTDVQQRNHTATVSFTALSDVARVTSSGQSHLLRILAPPHKLFPDADCGCNPTAPEGEQAEGERTWFASAANGGAEGESALLPNANPTSNRTYGLGGTPAGLWEVEGEGASEPAAWATPADGYLATDLLMAESETGEPTGNGIDLLPRIAADDDPAYLDAIDQL